MKYDNNGRKQMRKFLRIHETNKQVRDDIPDKLLLVPNIFLPVHEHRGKLIKKYNIPYELSEDSLKSEDDDGEKAAGLKQKSKKKRPKKRHKKKTRRKKRLLKKRLSKKTPKKRLPKKTPK